MEISIVSFYSFTELNDLNILLYELLRIGKASYLKGTILLAKEGFNGSISGEFEKVNSFIDKLIELTKANNVNIKTNYANLHPFQKLRVKLKEEIIAMKVDDLPVNEKRGEYISPDKWDHFINQDDVLLLDTRNDYEVEIGGFKNAVNPNLTSFRQFPEWVEENKKLLEGKKIAMFCTGGIRCEKTTAYLKHIGFNQVYHLEGGILQYLADTKNKNQLWEGKCFVFDDRRAVNDDLTPAAGFWLQRD